MGKDTIIGFSKNLKKFIDITDKSGTFTLTIKRCNLMINYLT